MVGPLVPSEAVHTLDQLPSGYEPPTQGPPDEGGIGPKRLVGALVRAKWWILTGAVLGGLVGSLVGRVIPKKYTADATVWIETRDRDDESRTSGPIRPNGFLQSRQWPELLESYVVLDSVVRRERLFVKPADPTATPLFRSFGLGAEFAMGNFALAISPDGRAYTLTKGADFAPNLPGFSFLRRGGLVVERGTVGDSIGKGIGWLWQPVAADLEKRRDLRFAVAAPREASKELRDRMKISVQGEQFMRITVADPSPERAAATLNSATEQLVSVATGLKKRSMIEQRDILAEQAEFAGKRLKEKEIELEQFRIRTVTLPNLNATITPGLVMTQPTAMTDYFEKKKRADELQRDRREILNLLDRNQAGELTVDAFQTIPTVKNAPDLTKALDELSVAETELRGLRFRYTDSLKIVQDVREKIATLRGTVIPNLARALARQLQRSSDDLTERIASETRELGSMPERSTTEQRLVREFEAAENLFKILRGRLEAAQLAQASQIPDIRAMDPAVPPRDPSGLTPGILIGLGLLLGLGAAAGIVLLRDILDSRINYPEQVSGGGIGLTILGVVPDTSGNSGDRELIKAQVVEAFREIRMNIVHSFPNGAPVMATISSPSPEDGKSFVCANLAMSFAEAGFKTLLIDGDTRRGVLHSSFQLDRRPGLVDYLLGRVDAQSIIRPTSHRHLSVIPCGERAVRSPELLGNAQMRALMATARSQYAVVLIDSPPFAAGVDPYILGSVTGALITVMRSGATDRRLAEDKLKVLDRLPIRPLGAVLNGVSLRHGSYRYYTYGYTAELEEEQPMALGPTTAPNPKEPVA